jgi:hypothetical protein
MNLNFRPLIFHPHRPCSSKEEHIGRNDILHQSFLKLNTYNIQNFVILGLPKSGKTSLINQICNPNVLENFIGKKKIKKYLFLVFDCQKHINDISSEDDFFRLFYKKIEKLLNITHLNKMTDLDKITQWLLHYDLRLIIIFDNFNLVITNPNFNIIFYDGLRSWFSDNKDIGCIITSPIHLLKLSVPFELSSSSFFNTFESFYLEPITSLEAIKLISDRLPKELDKSKKETLEIIKNTGFNPYELQLAGYLWLKCYKITGEIELKKSLPYIEQELIPYYNNIYISLTKKQIISIRKILNNKNNSKIDTDQVLISNGWVTKDKKNIVSKLMTAYFYNKFKIDDPKKSKSFKKIKFSFKNLLNLK